MHGSARSRRNEREELEREVGSSSLGVSRPKRDPPPGAGIRLDSLARDAGRLSCRRSMWLPLTEETLRSESTLDGFDFYLAEPFLQGAAAHGGLRVNP